MNGYEHPSTIEIIFASTAALR